MTTKRDTNKQHYRCECCGEVFRKGWTDEEARAEHRAIFKREVQLGPADAQDAQVCDVCYAKIMRWAKAKGLPH